MGRRVTAPRPSYLPLPGTAPTSYNTLIPPRRAGSRSARVVAFLQGNGFGNVFNLDGGMQAWEAVGKPVVTPAATPGVVI